MKWSHALAIASVLVFAAPRNGFALGCTGPTGLEGEMVYNSTAMVVQFCSGDGNWYSMSGTLATESDPQVGTLTGSKWCAANVGGTAIDCTADAPATGAAGSANEVQFRNSSTGAFAANANFVFDTATGRLGIGTTSPAAKLHVASGSVFVNTGGIGFHASERLTVAGSIAGYTGNTDAPLRLGNTASGAVTLAQFYAWGGSAWDGVAGNITNNSATGTSFNTTSSGAGGSMYSTTANNLQFSTNATPALTIDSGQRVGIGTTSPTNKLTVNGGIEFSAGAFSAGGSGAGVWMPGAGELGLVAGGATAVRINTAGSVGIGLANPGSLLHVASSGYPQFEKTFAGAPTAADCDAAGELGRQTIDTTNGRFYICTGAAGWKYASVGTSGVTSSQWVDGSSGAIYYNRGSVGIGTTSPSHLLTLSTPDRTTLALVKTNATAKSWYLNNSLAATNAFSISDETDHRLTILTDGKVGIGTTDPTAKLNVSDSTNMPSAPVLSSIVPFKITDGVSAIMMDSNQIESVGDALYINHRATGGTGSDTWIGGGGGKTILGIGGGNVGIGTTSPTAKLAVYGNLKVGIGGAANSAVLLVNTPSGNGAGLQLFQDANESWLIQNPANSTALTFSASGAERMRITTGGNVGIGTTNPTARLHVTGTIVGNVTGTNNSGVSGLSSTGYGVYGESGAGGVGVVGNSTAGGYGVWGISSGWAVYCSGGSCGGNASWSNTSDIRLKTDIRDLPESDGLSAIVKLRPVRFRWKDREQDALKGERIGLIAQEVEEVFPEVVDTSTRDTNINLGNGKRQIVKSAKSLGYADLVVPLIKAVQELKAANDNQAAEIRELRDVVTRQGSALDVMRRRIGAQ